MLAFSLKTLIIDHMNESLSNIDGYGHPISEIDLKTLSKGDSIRMHCADGVDRYLYVDKPGEQPIGLYVAVNPDETIHLTNFRLVGEAVNNHLVDSRKSINSHKQEIPPRIGEIALGCRPLFADVNQPDNNTRNQRYSMGVDSVICELYVKIASNTTD